MSKKVLDKGGSLFSDEILGKVMDLYLKPSPHRVHYWPPDLFGSPHHIHIKIVACHWEGERLYLDSYTQTRDNCPNPPADKSLYRDYERNLVYLIP